MLKPSLKDLLKKAMLKKAALVKPSLLNDLVTSPCTGIHEDESPVPADLVIQVDIGHNLCLSRRRLACHWSCR